MTKSTTSLSSEDGLVNLLSSLKKITLGSHQFLPNIRCQETNLYLKGLYYPPSSITINQIYTDSLPSISKLDFIGGADSLSKPEDNKVFSITAGSCLATRCLADLSFIATVCSDTNEKSSIGMIVKSAVTAIMATLVFAVFGASLGSTILNAVKIHQATSEINFLKRNATAIQNTIDTAPTSTPKEARLQLSRIFALAGLHHLTSVYQTYRATKITSFVCSLLATIALAALVAAGVLAFCFSGAALTSTIFAAIMGCGIAGGSLIMISLITLVGSALFSLKKTKQAAHHLCRSLTYTMMADRLQENLAANINLLESSSLRDCWEKAISNSDQSSNLLSTAIEEVY